MNIYTPPPCCVSQRIKIFPPFIFVFFFFPFCLPIRPGLSISVTLGKCSNISDHHGRKDPRAAPAEKDSRTCSFLFCFSLSLLQKSRYNREVFPTVAGCKLFLHNHFLIWTLRNRHCCLYCVYTILYVYSFHCIIYS